MQTKDTFPVKANLTYIDSVIVLTLIRQAFMSDATFFKIRKRAGDQI